ncbi:MAG: hypothetical protein GY910_04905 [bacterium]|nr:hypothetical protein [bacterium]
MRSEAWLGGRRGPVFLVLSAALLGFAWSIRFVQDDAFISFLYAKQMVSGHGLTWFGTYVEGYTNFLWVLWIAVGLQLGVDPVTWAHLGSMASFAAALSAVWRMAHLLTGSQGSALLAVLMFGTNYTVASYATGGLETMLQTAVVSWAAVGALALFRPNRESLRSLLALSLLLTAAVLTRLDSVVLGFWIGVTVLWALFRRGAGWPLFASFLLPLALILGGWLAWKFQYYGSVLPNTFAAKVGWDRSTIENGLLYLARFFHWYLIWPVLLVGGIAGLIGFRRGRLADASRRVWLLVPPILTWFAYVVVVGGDFMEFRFFVPVSPFLFVLLAALVHGGFGGAVGRPALCSAIALSLLVVASGRHATRFSGTSEDKTLDSIPALSTFYGHYPEGRWDRIGNRLREGLTDRGTVIAVHAVGAIPYYSGLDTVDMWGLNDPWIARHGEPAPAAYRRPGHRRHATLKYLRERGVNFVIGEPTRIERGELTRMDQPAVFGFWLQTVISFNRVPIEKATLVAMPLDGNEALLMWYLTPTAEIDRAIAEGGWERKDMRRRLRPDVARGRPRDAPS